MREFLLAGALLLSAGCATLPDNVQRTPSYALQNPQVTALGRLFAPITAAHPGESGFVPLVSGTTALRVSVAFAGLAERTLDLQYYIWADDLTGRIMLQQALLAAERGVRVRILLDDIHTDDSIPLGIVDAHPHIEVRLFNPFGWRDARKANWLVDGARLNHRMHNKAIVVDNSLAVTGGRNIADHYFAVDEDSNFRDLDLLAVGPAVSALSASFDNYWNSAWAYPANAIVGGDHTAAEARGLLDFLHGWVAAQARLPFTLDTDPAAMRARLVGFFDRFLWGRAYAVFDVPAKVTGERGSRVADLLFDATRGVGAELLLEVSYLIPGERGVALLAELVERGVRVRVLTNSLATNDIAAAHAGYMGYRDDLLRAGVELYELRPDAAAEQRQWTLLAAESTAALHTKAFVYDRRTVFVGSFNLDPRSIALNTEMGILVESPALAERVAQLIETGMRPENSYRLLLVNDELRWRLQTGDDVVLLDAEPETSWWERLVVSLLALLPIEEHL